MKLLWKAIATVLFYAISGALLGYAAMRSLDFITSTLPPEQQLTGYLALAATSGGMIGWLLVFLYKAEGVGQKTTAALMVVIDLLGEIALFTFDTLYQTGQAGMTTALTASEVRTVVLGLSGLIGLNILATVAFHLVEPDNIKAMRESFVRDRLENDALKLIEKRGDELAQKMAPALAEQWAADFEKRFSDLASLGLGTIETKKQTAKAKADQAKNWPAIPWAIRRPAPADRPEPIHAETVAPGHLVNVASDGHPKDQAGAK